MILCISVQLDRFYAFLGGLHRKVSLEFCCIYQFMWYHIPEHLNLKANICLSLVKVRGMSTHGFLRKAWTVEVRLMSCKF